MCYAVFSDDWMFVCSLWATRNCTLTLQNTCRVIRIFDRLIIYPCHSWYYHCRLPVTLAKRDRERLRQEAKDAEAHFK